MRCIRCKADDAVWALSLTPRPCGCLNGKNTLFLCQRCLEIRTSRKVECGECGLRYPLLQRLIKIEKLY